MLNKQLLYDFSETENEQYDLQTIFSQHRFYGAEDALNSYSCHSQQHILEVMRECGGLLDAVKAYLHHRFPQMDEHWAKDHLLLAAKMHDIGMSGTPVLRELLEITDQAGAWLQSGQPVTDAVVCMACRANQLAKDAGMEGRCWRDFAYYCAMGLAGESPDTLVACIREMHDEIKRTVRKDHALNSALFLLENKEEFQARYGNDVSITYVAILAMMHSKFMNSRVKVAPDSPDFEEIHAYVCRIVATHTEDSSFEIDRETLRQLLFLATLLRLGDTRRSGRATHALSKRPMEIRIDDAGRATVGTVTPGGNFLPVSLTESNEILAAEICTEYGSVALSQDQQGTWHMHHDITLAHADHAYVQRVFIQTGLRAYVKEIMSGGIANDYGFRHTVHLHLAKVTDEKVSKQLYECAAQAEWLREYPVDLIVNTDIQMTQTLA